MATFSCSAMFTPRDSRNLWIFNGWLLGTVGVFGLARVLLGKDVISPGPLAWTLAGATTLLALLTVRSYMVFLRHADELLLRTQLEALALGFGAGWMFMLCYRLFERIGAPKIDISDPMLVMVFFWGLGQVLAMRRYAPESGR